MIRATLEKRFAPGPESAGFHLQVEIEAGPGVTVLYGPSGSGKTLTLDAIAGLTTPDAGRIMLDDRILFDAGARVNVPARLRTAGYVFQNYALFPHMTVRENLKFAAHALPRLERHRRITEQLERFRLTPMGGRYPHELSGGQKQRASIARALIANPRVVLLDEPARGLDPELRAELYRLIEELRDSLRVPIFLVTHDLEECLALAGNVLVYEAGRVVHRASPTEVLRNPGTEAIARLLGGFNLHEAEVLALDPARQTSRLRILGEEIDGPNLRGCFRGDRVRLCSRPEELRLATSAGPNRIGAELKRSIERPQFVRAEFAENIAVDLPRESWKKLQESAGRWWIEIPADSLRQIAR